MRWAPITSKTLALTTSLAKRAFDTVFPISCVFCGKRQEEGRKVCPGCHDDLPRLADSQPPVTPLTAVMAPFEYAFPVDAAIKALKFRRRLFYAPAFAHLLLMTFADLPEDIDALLPMPLHWRRQAMRGFNQAAEIARPIRAATGLPVVKNVIRHRSTPYQSGLTASQRKRNLASAFRARGPVSHAHVLIIDDVITTGETCRQLARVVLGAGAQKVSAIAVARTLV
jgi:ComF family protein